MTTIYLEDVLDSIESQHCVVLLGPNVPKDKQGNILRDAVFQYAQTQFPVSRDSEGLLRFQSGRDQTRFPNIYRRFSSREAALSPLHLKLVELPIHLYLSLTPDHLLQEAFEEKGLSYRHETYQKGRAQPQITQAPTADQPLIYNLFGSIREPDSLIYTQDDLFDFLFSIMGSEYALPEMVLHTISSARLFLFLGFRFDQWYLKLLLRLFNLHHKRIALSIGTAANDDKVKAFYQDQFEMVFVPQAFEQYVTSVHTQWAERHAYRRSDSQERSYPDRILACIRTDQLEEGLDLLSQYLETRDQEENKTAIMLSGKYYGTIRKLHYGALSEEEANRSFAHIRQGVLNLLNP